MEAHIRLNFAAITPVAVDQVKIEHAELPLAIVVTTNCRYCRSRRLPVKKVTFVDGKQTLFTVKDIKVTKYDCVDLWLNIEAH